MTLFVKLILVSLLLAATIVLSRWIPKHPRWRALVIALNLVVTCRYLWWRTTETLNWESAGGIAVSLTVYLAELYGFMVVLHHYLIAMRSTERRAPSPAPDHLPTVDILVTTYNEGTDILYRTIVGCLAIDYPHKRIHVLDDGRRAEVEDLCRRLEVDYITREDNAGAKAGNLNHALGRTDGELVVTFDADHIPLRTFLSQTVGFFSDPRVAQVQTAHHFYNPDLFQDRLRASEYIANEQDMFYHVVQPGRDVYNSSFYCGSGAVLRRSALREIGGIPTATVTEDIHTTLMLHSRGWLSVFLNKDLSAGLAPESYEAYVTQRKRWALGTLQVMLKERGLFAPGLSAMQRVNYLATLWYWLYGLPRLTYVVAPLAFLLVGLRPLVIKDVTELLVYYLPHLCVSIAAFQLVNKGMRRIFWSDVYESCIAVHVALVAMAFPFRGRKRARFVVTPKGERAAAKPAWRLAWPVAALAAALTCGILVGVISLVGSGGEDDGTMINVVWAAYNLVILTFGLLLLRRRPSRRGAVRLRRHVPCVVSWNDRRIEVPTADLSETGLSFHLDKPRALPEYADIEIGPPQAPGLTLRARLVRCDVEPSGGLSAALEFIALGDAQHRRLVEILFCQEDAWLGPHSLTMGAPEHLFRILRSVAAIFAPARRLRRMAPRFRCDLVAGILRADGSRIHLKVTDVSMRGAALRLPTGQPVPSPEEFRLRVAWNGVERTTLDARVRDVRPGAAGERILGVVFVDPSPVQRADLMKHLYGEKNLALPADKAS